VSGHEDPNIRTPSYDRKLPDIPNDPNDLYKNSVKVRRRRFGYRDGINLENVERGEIFKKRKGKVRAKGET
jgi:hypothetical protein